MVFLPRIVAAESFAGPRVFTPLLIYVAILGAPFLRWRAMTPLLLVLPRVTLQILAPLLAFFGASPRH